MSKDINNPSSIRIVYTGLCPVIGMILGGILGLIADNMPVFAGVGMAIGLSIGAALDKYRAEDNS